MALFIKKSFALFTFCLALTPTYVKSDDGSKIRVTNSGIYIGLDFGYLMSENKLELLAFNDNQSSTSLNLNGAVFLGHRWEYKYGFMELESALRFRERKDSETCFPRQVCRLNIGNSLVVRAALGTSLNDVISIYGFGGIALADVESLRIHTGLRSDNSINPANVNRITFDGSGTMVGYIVGLGYDHKLNDNYSLRLEGAYTDFGTNQRLTNPPVENIMEYGFSEFRVSAGFVKRF